MLNSERDLGIGKKNRHVEKQHLVNIFSLESRHRLFITEGEALSHLCVFRAAE